MAKTKSREEKMASAESHGVFGGTTMLLRRKECSSAPWRDGESRPVLYPLHMRQALLVLLLDCQDPAPVHSLATIWAGKLVASRLTCTC